MSNQLSVEQIQSLMKCISENEIGELLFETGDVKLRIRGKQTVFAAQATALSAPCAAPPAVPAAEVRAAEAAPENAAAYITSPIVGTFYASSAPDKDPFVSVGQSVRKGENVFIVESMKVMNEIPCECDGVVAEILVADGDPVEYGQPVLRLE